MQSSVSLSPHVMELLASRMCHDLISPIGAISNGVELIEEFGMETGDEAMGLISSSATKASIHLRAFRWAYGASGADSDVKPSDIKEIFTKWVGLTKAELHWADSPILTSFMPPRGMLKCLLNVLIIASESLGMGGTISFEVSSNDPMTFLVAVQGPKLTTREGVLEALSGNLSEDQLDPRNVHGYITKVLCDTYGVKVHIEEAGENSMMFTLEAQA